jgi:hypothetical protein
VQTTQHEPTATPASQNRAAHLAAHHAATLTHYSQDQKEAALRLFNTAKRHLGTGGGNTCAKLLLGIYNGHRFPFDLTDLRRLDDANLNAAIVVLHMDAAHTWCEIHVLLDAIVGVESGKSTGSTLELWAYELRLKTGRCSKAELVTLQARAA